MLRRTLGWTLLALAAACGRGGDASSESAAAVPVDTGPPAVGIGEASDSTCPRTGRWAPCSLEDRLENTGLAPRRDGDVTQTFFSVPGARYRVGRAELQAFIYPSEREAAKDLANFDTVRVGPRDAVPAWPAHPTLIRSANLVAILLSDAAPQIERVQLALTAGPPMPAAPATLPAARAAVPARR